MVSRVRFRWRGVGKEGRKGKATDAGSALGGWGALRWGNSNEFLAGGGEVAMKRRRRA